MLLAIDTSTEVAGIALFDEVTCEPRAERTWRSGRNHTRELLPEIDGMLADAGLQQSDVTGLAVATGPGSFNGLRVGLTTAKLMAFALSVPLVGVDTLRVSAQAFVLIGRPIRALLDAGRGQICTAVYQPVSDAVHEVEAPRIADLSELVRGVDRPTVFCGEIRPEWRVAIENVLGSDAIFPTPGGRLRRAAYLAELGWRALLAGHADDPVTLQPLYLRRPTVMAGER